MGETEQKPPTVATLLLDASYDDAELLITCASHGIDALAPCPSRLVPLPRKTVVTVLLSCLA